MLRRLAWGFLALVVFAAGVLGWHNRPVAPPAPDRIAASLERGIRWIDARRDVLLRYDNPVIWWMTWRAAALTGDPGLETLVAEYLRREKRRNPGSFWHRMFDPSSRAPLPDWELDQYPYYNLMFFYGFSCLPELLELEIVRQQLEPDFCPSHRPVSPACATHQLIGARFMQMHGCGRPAQVEALIASLQDRIVRQLVLDPRRVDVTVQRVLMLVDSGAADRVRPAWLHAVLDSQLDDGGWAGFHPLLPVGGGRHLVLTSNGAGIRRIGGDFHAVAQAVLLLALLDR